MNIWLLLWVAFLILAFFYNYYKIHKINRIKSCYGNAIKGKVIHLDREKNEIVVETKFKGRRIHVSLVFKYGKLSSSKYEIDKVISSESKFRQVYINKSDLRLSSLTDPRNVVPFRYYGYCAILIAIFIFTLWVLV
ncbi:hypothetical protein DC859_24370 [Vibrio parahaemolyticus]|nr:hypothetical protein [Vibrio parahaemolyticus]KOY40055.1 hypothetical protein ACX10_06270 [Vibrio parahaemolyticus]